MTALSKPASKLTPEELKALAKPIGIKGRPYPMRDTAVLRKDGGKLVLQQRLSVLQAEKMEDALRIYSERPYDQVFGMAMREMPTPGMLKLFYDAVRLREPDSQRRIHYLKGKAGTGKTYLAELAGRMRSEKKTVVIDCGGKDLRELLFETVLDFGKNKSFYEEFDKRIDAFNAADSQAERDATLHPQSITTLKEHLGEAFTQDSKGQISIDWSRTSQCLKDSDGNYRGSLETVGIVNDGLMSVARKEGFADVAGNALGMATQHGALIKAMEEGHEIVLDEFNRAKKGSSVSLHSVLQFLAGERPQVTVENTLKEKGDATSQFYTFRRSEVPIGFFCTLTGNDLEDGNDVEELPESLNSRIIPQSVPVATEEDWQHRWCQILTGLPLSTIYRINQKQADADPDAFRGRLMAWREVGLPEGEIIPDYQMTMIQSWEDTLQATEKLARFFYGWSQIVDPDSTVHRSGNLANLLDEIDEDYKKETSIDFRKIMYFITEAVKLRPTVTSLEESEGFSLSDDFSKPPSLPSQERREDPALNFGTRLVQAVISHLSMTTLERGKNGIYMKLMQHAADSGLSDPGLAEGKPSASRSVADLLNFNRYRSQVPSVKVEAVRDLLCNRLREIIPNIKASNDELMSLAMVRNALDDLNRETPAADQGKQALAIFNEDPDKIYKEPLVKVEAVDSVANAEQAEKLTAKNLVSRTSLLFALTAPAMREKNLEALWAKVFTSSGLFAENMLEKNEPLAMAEGRSDEDLAVTTVMVANDDRRRAAKPLHVVWDKACGHLLVMGEGSLGSELDHAFRLSGATYIDKNAEGAAEKAGAALDAIVGSNKRRESLLKTAFLMRAGLADPKAEQANSLAEIMASKKTKALLPVYITNKPIAPAA